MDQQTEALAGRTSRVQIVAALREIGARLRVEGGNRFRARAYEAGAAALEEISDQELARHLAAGTLTEVTGIGPALAAVVTELARDARAAVLDRLRSAMPPGLLELSQVPGISRKRALKLHEALGITNIDELATAASAGRVREV